MRNNLKYVLFILALTSLILAILITQLNFLKFDDAIAMSLGIFAMVTSLFSAFLGLHK
ncbi:hypothetical protein [Weissella bombi]|uniref:Uncharacterized protein n=1 Tax=Weissella bombi TaxID=1505725 RepID=A0A1C3Z8M2_9LACO|nr:hypothetical protein [Weissella bombi]SCB78719.1 hypothetical protein GA0061074_101367 [Weissella bombi]